MMSRGLGFFGKPLKAVFETTLYSVGAAGVGTGVYRMGTLLNEKTKEHQDKIKERFTTNNSLERDQMEHDGPSMKF